MKEEVVEYQVEGKTFKGFLAYDPAKGKCPGVLVAHAWRGQDDFARQKAKDLANLGYVGFAADVYGDALSVTDNEAAQKLMIPLFVDRSLLRKRIMGAFSTLEKQPMVDKDKMGAIGFCFGGLTVIELLMSGANLKGVVSFHGLLGTKLGPLEAKLGPLPAVVKSSLLALHGNDDPLVSEEDILRCKKEWTALKIDWQIHIYGHVKHAFSNPQANDLQLGLLYNATAATRAWLTMCNFFKELF